MAERRRRSRRGRPAQNPVTYEAPVTEPAGESTASKLLRRCKARVEAGKEERKKWREDYRVDELAEAATGVRRKFEDALTEGNTIWINKFDPTLKTLLPSLFYNAPKFKYDVISGDLSADRQRQGRLISGLVQRICQQDRQLERAARLAIQQATHSIGVIKIVYDPKFEPNPRKGEVIYRTNDADEPLVGEDGEAMPLLDADGQPVVEPEQIITDEVYRIEWVNAENMIFPPKTVDPGKWGWLAEEICVSLEDAKEDLRIPKRIRDTLKPNGGLRPDEDGFDDDPITYEDEEDQEFRYIEYYDLKNHRYYGWADDVGDEEPVEFLFDEPLPKGIEDHPYSLLMGFTPILDPKPKAWPMPLTYNWLPIEIEHNDRRYQLTNAARHSARKVAYDQSTFRDHEQAQAALASSIDMEAFEVQDIQRLPVVMADAPPPMNLAQDLAALEGDWIRATGLASSAFGTSAGSATEARLENQAGSIRESDQRRMVTMFMEDLGRKLFNLVRATMTVGMSVKMISMTDGDMAKAFDARFGPGSSQMMSVSPELKQSFIERFGDEHWQEVNREDITFDADVTVTPGSMKSRTIEAERQQFLEFISTVLSSPIGLQSRELLLTFARMYEFIDERVVDELVALGEKAAALEAQKAGRFQGDDGGAAGQQAVMAASRGTQGAQNGVRLQDILGVQ